MTKRPLLRLAAVVCGWTLFATLVIQLYAHFVPYSLAWNQTSSIPRGFYWAKAHDGKQLARGDLACFRYRAPDWASNRDYFPDGFRLCKPVAGLPGDSVVKEDGKLQVFADGKLVEQVSVATADRQGRPLETHAMPAGVVPVGQLVLLAPKYPNSLDSRFLGLIEASKVTHQIWPLWVYE